MGPMAHMMREGIRFTHGGAWVVAEGVVEPQEEEGPAGLSVIQVLGHSEVFQVLVIHPDLDRMLGSLKEVSPLL